MNFSESESYLLSLGNEVEAMKLGLENIRKLLKALGDPQKKYLKVQVAGTNGKGSVCAFLNSICREASVEVGVFTSPHLISITERVRINGVDISEEEFARIATTVRETSEKLVKTGQLEKVPTFFEQVTAIALVAFAEAKVELAILETGMGGRYDATSAAEAEIAAITRIDLDHQEYLGDTIEKIAAEKAAIIDGARDAVFCDQQPGVLKILREQCSKNGIVPTTGDDRLDWKLKKGQLPDHVRLDTNLHSFNEFELGLKGDHQVENARIAVLISEVIRYNFGVEIPEEAIPGGLQNARHPGRLEHQGRYLFDGAHNIGGAEVLREYLDKHVTQPITMVFGAMKDKDISEIAAILFPRADKVILTHPDNSRAMSATEIAAITTQESYVPTKSVAEALTVARQLSADDAIILITGSLYLVGEAKRILKSQI